MNSLRSFAVAMILGAAACTTTSPKPDDSPTPVPSDCRCQDGCVEACEVADSTTTYRKIPREPDARDDAIAQEPPEAFDLWEERVEPLPIAELERVAADLDRKEQLIAGFRADFVRGRGEELAVLSQGGELSIYRDDAVFASLDLGQLANDDPVVGIRLVDDRAEVVVRSVTDGVEKLTVCRVIGQAIARVFEIDAAGRTIEFVHLGDERAIRVHHSDGRTEVFRWNPWEGMFRTPSRAPTAP